MNHASRSTIFISLIALASLGLSSPVFAVSEAVVHSFFGFANPADGAGPTGDLVLAKDGNFYGTTAAGGADSTGQIVDYGTVFKMTPAGVITILHSFLGPDNMNYDGASPLGGPIQGTDGNFYGTTQYGGGPVAGDAPATANGGTVYQMTLAGKVTILHSFQDQTLLVDGYAPNAGLVQGTDGGFYGTTYQGGANGTGTVFKVTINPTSKAVTMAIVHSFGVTPEPYSPNGDLMLAKDGNFYGTTQNGGANGVGTIYKMTTAGVVTILHSFASDGMDGEFPHSGLIQGTDSNFYGATQSGGTGFSGTIYEMTASGKVTILHNFGDGSVANDGSYPTGRLLQGPDGLYGMVPSGGSDGDGLVYKIVPNGASSVFTIVRSFGDSYDSLGNDLSPFDGKNPTAGLTLGAAGALYGATASGGESGFGTLFTITTTGTYTSLYAFYKPVVHGDGVVPNAPVIQGKDGNYYGTTTKGGLLDGPYYEGDSQNGTIFQLTPSGTLTVLHNFEDGTVINDGATPQAPLIQATDGNFYGTTVAGGAGSAGTIFQVVIDPTTGLATTTVLHSFGDGTTLNDGTNCYSPLVQATDGSFYGTTNYGGLYGRGTAYHMTLDTKGVATVTTLHSFGNGTDAALCYYAGLIQGKDGNFYGGSSGGGIYGGSSGAGTVYKMTPAGVVTILHSFGATLGTTSSYTDGDSPGAVIQGADGKLYGLCDSGGLFGYGELFRMSTSGTSYTALHNFGNLSANPYDPASPSPAERLIQLVDGNFAGTTPAGGEVNNLDGQPYSAGTVFEITPTGAFSLLHQFGASINDGFEPNAGLSESTDGSLFGTTPSGGVADMGTVYKVMKTAQGISFPVIPDHARTDAPFTIGATAGSGGPVTFSVVSGPAKISGSTVTLTGSGGVVTILAKQVGSVTYALVTATRSFNVTPVPQTIAFPTVASGKVGQTVTLAATATSGLPVTYSVVTTAGYSGAASINGSKITWTVPGNIKLAADQAGNATYAPATQMRQNIAIEATQTITFPTVASGTVGQTVTLTATATSGLPVTFSVVPTTGYTGTATISGSKLTFTGGGTLKLAADQVGGTFYQPATQVRQNVTVAQATQTITFPTVATGTAGLYATLKATSTSGLPVTYSIIPTAGYAGTATITGSNIAFTGPGTIKLAADQAGNASYKPAAEVRQNVTIISIQTTQVITFPTVAPGTVGQSVSLAATATSNLPVTYSIIPTTGYTGTATISGSTLTFTGAGTIKLAADQAGDPSYDPAPEVRQNVTITAKP